MQINKSEITSSSIASDSISSLADLSSIPVLAPSKSYLDISAPELPEISSILQEKNNYIGEESFVEQIEDIEEEPISYLESATKTFNDAKNYLGNYPLTTSK